MKNDGSWMNRESHPGAGKVGSPNPGCCERSIEIELSVAKIAGPTPDPQPHE